MNPPKVSTPAGPNDPLEPDTTSDRPTVPAPFDPAAFARHSELKLRAVSVAGEASPLGEARRLFAEGKPENALFVLATVVAQTPENAEAHALSAVCGAALEEECLSAIGSATAVLKIAMPPGELRRFGLDHVSGFLVSLIDGHTDVSTILDLSGLSRLLALRHLRNLVARGIVEVWRKQT